MVAAAETLVLAYFICFYFELIKFSFMLIRK